MQELQKNTENCKYYKIVECFNCNNIGNRIFVKLSDFAIHTNSGVKL